MNMQEEKEKYISDLKDKIRTIITFLDKTKDENLQLSKEKQDLLAQNKQKDEKIKELERELENAKIASVLGGNTEDNENETRHNAKIKINKMVREIDKCISLLNKLN